MIVLDSEQQKIFELVSTKKKNVFIQGQAGTGKSTLIEYIRNNSEKNVVVASPTAIAATNVGGCTLHSLFRLPPKDFFELNKVLTERKKTNDIVLKYMDILIIDEISMVRPDMLDAINKILKRVRKNKEPFGGVQMVLVGDLYQLPPIIKSDLKLLFKDIYGSDSPYFFDSNSYKQGNFEKCELTIVHRQEDPELLENLKNIRDGKNLDSTLDFFNNIVNKGAVSPKNAVIITPYKAKVDSINEMKLQALPGKEEKYTAKVTGTFKNMKETPAPVELKLKEGAFVMFNKNSKDKMWVNGSTGVITKTCPNMVIVKMTNTQNEVFVTKDVWELVHYDYDPDTKKITQEKVGTFEQLPLQLGWATTIHKSQSKTLDKVIIDTDRGVFAPGQLYVALSRTRKREDMVLRKELCEKDVILDRRITKFLKKESRLDGQRCL